MMEQQSHRDPGGVLRRMVRNPSVSCRRTSFTSTFTAFIMFATSLTMQSHEQSPEMQLVSIPEFAKESSACGRGRSTYSSQTTCVKLHLRGGTAAEVAEHLPAHNGAYSDLSGVLPISDVELSGAKETEGCAAEPDFEIGGQSKRYEQLLKEHEETCKPPWETSEDDREGSQRESVGDEVGEESLSEQFWRTAFQKRIGMRGPMWGDPLPANVSIPADALQPWGSASINNSWIGTLGDGSPALYGNVDSSELEAVHKPVDCLENSDSEQGEHVGEFVALYRERYKNSTPPHLQAANPARRGFWRWFGRGSTDPEGLVDEFSDGGWGERHWEVGRYVPWVKNIPPQHWRIWRAGKDIGESEGAGESDEDMMSGGAAGEQSASGDSGGEVHGEGEEPRRGRDEGAGSDEESDEAVDVLGGAAAPGREAAAVQQGEGAESDGSDFDLPLVVDPAKENGLLVTSSRFKSGERRRSATDKVVEGTWDGPETREYPPEEEDYNQMLRDQKWRRWRRQRQEYMDKHRPLWLPALSNESTFNITYIDDKGNTFPSEAGRDTEEAIDNTIEAYHKFQLDKLANRYQDAVLEWQAARHSPEDPSVTPWLERSGYKVRFRHSHLGFVENVEVKWDDKDYVCGSPEARKEVEEQLLKTVDFDNLPTCDFCDSFGNSEDEDGYLRRLDANPANFSALCDYGVLLSRQGRAQEAELALEKAYNRSRMQPSLAEPPARFPPHVTICHNYAVLCAERGDYDKTEALLREALDVHPAHVRSMVKLGELLEDERKALDDAEALYRKATDLEPHNSEALFSYGSFLLFVRGDIDAAEPVLELGCRLDPGWVHLQVAFSLVLLLRGRRDQARDGLRWSCAQEEGQAYAFALALFGYVQHNPRRACELHKLAGYSALRARSRVKLRALCKQTLPDGDESSELEEALSKTDLAEYQPAYAFTDIEKPRVMIRDLKSAEELYRQALALYPTQKLAGMGLAAVLQEQVDRDDAEVEELYKQVLSEDQHDPEVLGSYASWLWARRRDSAAAAAMWERAEEAVAVLRKRERRGLEGEWREHVLAQVRAENLCDHGHMVLDATGSAADAKKKAAMAMSEEGGHEMGTVLAARATALVKDTASALTELNTWLVAHQRASSSERRGKAAAGAAGGTQRARAEGGEGVLRWRRWRVGGAAVEVAMGELLAGRAGEGDWERAEGLFRGVLRQDPWDEGALAGLGRLLAGRGASRSALKVLRRAWRLSPSAMPLGALAELRRLLAEGGEEELAAQAQRVHEWAAGGSLGANKTERRRRRVRSDEGATSSRGGEGTEEGETADLAAATLAKGGARKRARVQEQQDLPASAKAQKRAAHAATQAGGADEGSKREMSVDSAGIGAVEEGISGGEKARMGAGGTGWLFRGAGQVVSGLGDLATRAWSGLRRWSGVGRSGRAAALRERRERRRTEKKARRWSMAVGDARRIETLRRQAATVEVRYRMLEQAGQAGPDEEREKKAMKESLKGMHGEMRSIQRRLEAFGGADGVMAQLGEGLGVEGRSPMPGRGKRGASKSLSEVVQEAAERAKRGRAQQQLMQDEGDDVLEPVGLHGFKQVVGSDGSAAIVPSGEPPVTAMAGQSLAKGGSGFEEKRGEKPLQESWTSWAGEKWRTLKQQVEERSAVFGEEAVGAVRAATKAKNPSVADLVGVARTLELRAAELARVGRERWARAVSRAAVAACQAAILSEPSSEPAAEGGGLDSGGRQEAWGCVLALALRRCGGATSEWRELLARGVEACGASAQAEVVRGRFELEATGDVARAERAAEAAAEKGGGGAAALVLQGRVCEAREQWREAEAAFEQAVRAAGEAGGGARGESGRAALVGLAMARVRAGRRREALQVLEGAERLQPGGAEVGVAWAKALVSERGREKEAAERAEAALRAGPRSRLVMVEGVRVLRAAGEEERAREVLAEAVQMQPWEGGLHVERARLAGAGRGGAEAALREAVRVAPYSGAARVALAERLEEDGMVEEAAEEYEAAVAVAPGSVEGLSGLATLCREELGEAARARGLLERALALEPGHAESLFQRGSLAEEEAGEEAAGEALRLYREAVAADPQHVGARVSAGDLLAARGEYTAAEAMFAAALEAAPGEGRVARAWGWMAEDRGAWEQAEALYRAAVTMDPGDVVALNRVGMLKWTRGGDAAGAGRAFRQALQEGEDAVVLRNYAEVLAGSGGSAAEAEGLLRRAIRAQPSDAGALCSLGRLRTARGAGGAAAMAAFEEAARVDPGSEEAAQGIAELRRRAAAAWATRNEVD